MCIIAIKKRDVAFPSDATIKTMWRNNPDGAGIMYTDGHGKVIIDKGYMKLEDFMNRINNLKKEIDTTAESVVLHFRIGTAGGNVPANTHPFPITTNVGELKALHLKAPIGVVHNGVITIKRPIEDISDTMEYIRSTLAYTWKSNHNFYRVETLMKKIEKEITSKMAFLLPDGSIYKIGNFVDADDGMIYSNYTYQDYMSRYGNYIYTGSYGYYGYDWWDDDDDDDKEYRNYPLYSGYSGKTSAKRLLSSTRMVKQLCYVDTDTFLINYDTGEMYETAELGDIMIDGNGKLYYVDYYNESYYGIAIPISSDLSAYKPNAAEVRFHYEDSFEMEVSDMQISIDMLV